MSRMRRSWPPSSAESPRERPPVDDHARRVLRAAGRPPGRRGLPRPGRCGRDDPATVQRRVRQGRWTRLHPGIYLVGGHRRTDEARIRAAWLWGGPYSVVTGPAAAYWHHMLDRAPAIVDLSVPACTSPRPQPGIRL